MTDHHHQAFKICVEQDKRYQQTTDKWQETFWCSTPLKNPGLVTAACFWGWGPSPRSLTYTLDRSVRRKKRPRTMSNFREKKKVSPPPLEQFLNMLLLGCLGTCKCIFLQSNTPTLSLSKDLQSHPWQACSAPRCQVTPQ